MRNAGPLIIAVSLFSGCAAEAPPTNDPLDAYEELNSSPVVDAPKPEPGRYTPLDRDAIERGEYLVEVLGCGSCHTDGSFDGAPDMTRPLAGSNTGIAWASPLEVEFPGIEYHAG